MESLRIGNRIVSYRAYGRDVDAQRPPVVLVHGAGGNHLMWPAQVRHLPQYGRLRAGLAGARGFAGTERQ